MRLAGPSGSDAPLLIAVSKAAELHRLLGGRPITIALEQSRGLLLFRLLKYEHLVLFPVHPSTLVNYRRGFRPSGAKSDSSQATPLSSC